MDWNKKNLLRVGDYFYSKRTEKNHNQCTSYFRNKIDEMREKMDGDEAALAEALESEVYLYLDGQLLDEPERDWINFLKENNCEQFKTSSELWMIHNKKTPDNILVPMYKVNDSREFGEPGDLILCPKDFAEKILKLESFRG